MADKENLSRLSRILEIYMRFMNGEVINKKDEANRYGVNEKTIQRDIEEIRSFISSGSSRYGTIDNIVYDRRIKGYYLEKVYNSKLSNSEILAICKILLDSRAFTKTEMQNMLEKLVELCVPRENQRLVRDLILNEEFHYIEPHHGKVFIDKMLELGQAIRKTKYVEIDYMRTKDKAVVRRKLKPLAIMFSEYYFYLTAFIDDEEVRKDFDVINDSFPTIYRIDRIQKLKVLNESFHIPYKDRFEEGEFRKRIQFMYGGKLQKITFKYFGGSPEPVLDRLPTAKIVSEDETGITITAEVFGKGIDMWLRSQGDSVKILSKN
ncbi:MAG: WYL domain-containing protein [Clostridiales bacterium]|nr:WYL domain-containing protein [Clostridiales bacterium]